MKSGAFIPLRYSARQSGSYPDLTRFETKPGVTIPYKGRFYCWVHQHQGILSLPTGTMGKLGVQPGDNLLLIRGSNLGFVCAKKGPIVEKARDFPGIPVFE